MASGHMRLVPRIRQSLDAGGTAFNPDVVLAPWLDELDERVRRFRRFAQADFSVKLSAHVRALREVLAADCVGGR